MRYERNLLFNSMHKDWYICEESHKNVDFSEPQMVLDFYKGEPDVLQRCSFAINPITVGSDKLRNCRDVMGPVRPPAINGQPLPHPPHLISPTPPPPPALPACIPVCPAGTVGGTEAGGTSALTFPASAGVSSVHESARKSLFLGLKIVYLHEYIFILIPYGCKMSLSAGVPGVLAAESRSRKSTFVN